MSPRSFLAILLAISVWSTVPAIAAPRTFPLTTSVVGEGSVDPASGAYKRNNIVVLTATPDAGWRFDHWQGAAAGSDNPTSVRISGDTHVGAVFAEDVEPPPPPPPPPPGEGGAEVVGYFVQWGIYQRDYFVKNIATSGSAEVLTTINYAFAGIDSNLRCASLDPFADWEKRLDASESIDGVADTVSQTLKGNFNQLRKLKQSHPHIRLLISIGGWTESHRFSDAALAANRAAFAQSCIDMFVHGDFAPGVSEPGLFDGIDIDWEYPGRCGDSCNFRPEDKQNFTALLAEFRSRLDAVDPGLLLTIAAPVGEYYHSQMELGLIHPYLDWINLMAYDYHGAWEGSAGPTNHHAPLYASDLDPSSGGGADTAVSAFLAAEVPAEKLILGLPFYGRGWSGVRDVDNGLYQRAKRIPRGQYERGVDDYERLAAKGFPSFWDPVAQASWIFNGSEFWSLDDADSIRNKGSYIRSKGLGGIMFWELSGDDPQGTLIRAIGEGLQ
jgi:chitinase